ncbi:MAG: hypothetical protein ACI4KF_09425 [Huintestinicola sp.]
MLGKNTGRYDHIIDLPHHTSCNHPPLPASDRAAQFAPFAAMGDPHEITRSPAELHQEDSCFPEQRTGK